MIIELTAEMQNSAEMLEFEKAIEIRDKIKELEKRIGTINPD
jgi:protein-arginine kinase activator protein McsA